MKSRIYKALEEVQEPTLGVDIVNLGLVYEVCIKNEKDIEIVMTTRNGDTMLSDYIAVSARELLEKRVENLGDIDIKMVASPKWTKERMSRYAKFILDL
ncbi:metal-sulfur cluster assembly factor [Bacillus sp. REN3]|uniref:metal-sulfur cluster assembly factor n=1 Tax=Bacillus sp. REN3 TaxID=2802440 RepID=UPI001AEE5DD9|nr:metal-sulfur cluster assembly factor [Bacillus sp. REN3]